MTLASDIIFVFIAGLITALATGLGAIPFFIYNDISKKWTVILWGLASGIMISASIFGLVIEAEAYKSPVFASLGVLFGVLIVFIADIVLDNAEVNPKKYEEVEFKKLILILGILTVHSFPEGVAVGVSFAEIGINGTELFGFVVPILGIYMTIAISIHNIPEGLSISIPLRNMDVSKYRMVWWSIFSSLPQPIGAVIAFLFVRIAEQFLPFGYGFAAGAMIFLVITEFIPEAKEEAIGLDDSTGTREIISGFVAGFITMVPLLLV